MKYMLLVLTLISTGLHSDSVRATLIGDSVFIDGFINPVAGPFIVTDPGVEYVNPNFTHWEYDVGASSVSATMTQGAASTSGGAFATFSDLDWVDHPAGVIKDIILTSNLTNTTFSASFTDHTVTLSWTGNWDTGEFMHVDIVTSDAPEPATLALLGLGLAGIGFSRRKKK